MAEAVLTSTHNLCLSRNMKTTRMFHLRVFVFCVKFSIYLNRRVFIMSGFVLLCVQCFQSTSVKILLYFTVAGVKCRVAAL